MQCSLKHFALVVGASSIALLGGCQSQRTFRTPEEAVGALQVAVKQQDKSELRRIFGDQTGKLKSGDLDQDEDDAIVFSRKLAAAHKVRQDAPDRASVLIGEDQWPFAVPLVMKGSAWRFDTAAGLEEMTNRRIGRNELLTIEACRTLIDAEAEFFNRDPDGLGVKHYAQRLMSTEGKKDGLYWPAPGGVDPSPIGPVMAMAASKRDAKGQHIPFNGYLFKVLKGQAASASKGEIDYTENGQLTHGWAVIAYPAVYGQTGITSFLCSSDGDVYQQDLGKGTSKAVDQIDLFAPDDGWEKVEDAPVEQKAST